MSARRWIAAGLAVGALAIPASAPGGPPGGKDGNGGKDAAPRAPAAFFGVSPQLIPTSNEIRRMGRGGIGTLRMQVSWAAAQPEAPETPVPSYDFSQLDPIVLAAARQGMRVLPFVYSTPAWVANDLDGRGCPPNQCYFYAPRSAEALEAWEEFLEALVERYRPGGRFWLQNPDVPERPIRAWQIWNEQNSQSFFRPAPDVGAYAELLASSARAIRAEDPGAEVVLGGMFGTPFGGEPPAITAWDYLDALYAIPGAAADFDGVAPHPYAGSLRKVKKQVRRSVRATKRAGDAGVGFWITEIGWASAGPKNPLVRGSRGQARRLREGYRYFLRKRQSLELENVTWYSWRDNTTGSSDPCEWCRYAGLFEENRLEPKRAWKAFTRFTGGR